MRTLAIVMIGVALSSSALAQVVDDDKVRHMAAAVQLSGHDCEGMAGAFLGTRKDGTKFYIVECRGGDRFVYFELPGGDKVGVTPCAVVRMKGFDC